MNVITVIAETLATILDVVFCWWFVRRFNQKSAKEKPWTLSILAVMLAFQLIADHFLAGFNALYTVVVFFLAVCYALALEHKKIFWAIFSACCFELLTMLGSSLIAAVFLVFGVDFEKLMQYASGETRIVFLIVIKLTQFILMYLILLIFRRNKDIDIKNGILAVLFSLATAVGLGLLMKIASDDQESQNRLQVLILALILIFVNVAFYVMIRQIQKYNQSKYQLRLMEERMNAEKTRMEEAQTVWQNIRKTKHDLKNHFLVMSKQLEDGDVSACRAYMAKLADTVESMGDLIRSGNTVIDYLINSKLSGLQDVQVVTSGYVGNYADIEDVDLAAILGNILDNAVEAEKSVKGTKRIELSFLKKNENRIIILRNAIDSSVLQTNKELKSTKKSSEAHGLGHKIVESTVAKYHGMVDYFESDGMFGVEIILPENNA